MIMLIMLINMLMIVIVDFQDPKSLQLLAGLVEAAMKSPLRGRFGNFSVFFFDRFKIFGEKDIGTS